MTWVCFMIKSGLPFLVSQKSRKMYRVERFKLKIIPSRWDGTLQPGDQRHAGRRIAKSAILKMCRRGSAWCGVRAQGFLVDKVVEGCRWNQLIHQTPLVLHHPTFVWFSGVDSSRVCFPFPIIHFGLWPDNLSRGLVITMSVGLESWV